VDSYFGKEDTVSGIFDQEVSALIPGIFDGTNATVFAYGATGSGKTYTMQVSNPSSSLARNVFGKMSPKLLGCRPVSETLLLLPCRAARICLGSSRCRYRPSWHAAPARGAP
jgi:hypothetical protein